jgi:aspartyl-tRNA(Asn)/glutamyl-tRNA(Gln) amidotransferase subunit A
MPTTAGCYGWPEAPAAASAPVIERLETAGAVFVAKLSTPELNCGSPVNEMLGVVANPHDHRRWSGGSSAGPAAAVAAGLLPVAVGEDTGGSIRLPAAHCGILGLRPTLGRVPGSGCVPVAWTMDQLGPMASTAEDIALLMEAMAGHDPSDPMSIPSRPPDYRVRLGRAPAGLTVGVVRNWFGDLIDSDVSARFDDSLALLRSIGTDVIDVALPSADLSTAAVWVIIRSEFAAFLLGRPDVLARCETETRRRAGTGMLCSTADYVAAQRFRREAQREFEQVCRRVDLVITPAAPSTAGYIRDGEAYIDVDGVPYPWNTSARTTAHFGYIGCPALVVPFGVADRDGMPVGVQLAGMPDSEPVLIQVADAIQTRLSSPESKGTR